MCIQLIASANSRPYSRLQRDTKVRDIATFLVRASSRYHWVTIFASSRQAAVHSRVYIVY